MRFIKIIAAAAALSACFASGHADEPFAPWTPGYLDIHHISVEGDAALFVFPDGTTMLFDAGEDRADIFNARVPPLRAAGRRPNASKSAGAWIADYIREAAPKPTLDYALVSHFHSDHYGQVTGETPQSAVGPYRLTGVVEVAERLGVGTLIDRAYPDYAFPAPLSDVARRDKTLGNYLAYVAWREKQGKRTERLAAGRADQITPTRAPSAYPAFEVRAIKSSNVAWTGEGNGTFSLFDAETALNEHGRFSENPMSLALRVTYGAFDYFTAGDLLGPSSPDFPAWLDHETPLAPIVGEVDVFALNHHGVRDANNATFISALQPQAHIIQGRTSDHPGQEVFFRLMSQDLYPGPRDVFSTYVHPETLVTYGPWFNEGLKSKRGHILVRVSPGGASFEIIILDDARPGLHPIARFGPYLSREAATIEAEPSDNLND